MVWGDSFKDDFYELKVVGLSRKLPKVKIHDELTIASFVMFGDTELIEKCADHLCEKLFTIEKCDYLVCPEAKAIPLTHACARILGVNYIVIRKSIKGYMSDPISEKVESITTVGEQNLVLDKVGANVVCRAAVLLEEAGYENPELIYLEKLPIFTS